jgi:hypothetical protein
MKGKTMLNREPYAYALALTLRLERAIAMLTSTREGDNLGTYKESAEEFSSAYSSFMAGRGPNGLAIQEKDRVDWKNVSTSALYRLRNDLVRVLLDRIEDPEVTELLRHLGIPDQVDLHVPPRSANGFMAFGFEEINAPANFTAAIKVLSHSEYFPFIATLHKPELWDLDSVKSKPEGQRFLTDPIYPLYHATFDFARINVQLLVLTPSDLGSIDRPGPGDIASAR